MTQKRSPVRLAVLVTAIPFVASLPACEAVGSLFVAKPATESQPAQEAPIETMGRAVAPLLPPPFNLLLPIGVGALVAGATVVASSKVEPKKEQP